MTYNSRQSPVGLAIEIAVSLLLVFIVLAWCLQILRPFASLIIWGGVIAISLHTPFQKLVATVGGRRKLALTIFAVSGLAVILVPSWLFFGSIVDSSKDVSAALQSGQFNLSPPSESVKEWPLVGERVYTSWAEASSNLQGWLEEHHETVRQVLSQLFGKVAGIGVSILQFLASVLIATALLAHAETVSTGIERLLNRIMGSKSDEMLKLSTATVRSITTGVLGIAFVQALLGGLGMVVVGVPGAGIWALLILLLAVAQLPPLLVLLPAIFYVFSVESTTVASIFAIWSIAVSFSDALLKPMLLGRGVEAPMLVILLGAIGGMLMSGIIGLFVGAVVLALGYTLLKTWLETEESDDEPMVEEEPA
jgi:predicted PurR-regulated permease PerM